MGLRERLWGIPKKWFLFGIPLGAFIAFVIGMMATVSFDVGMQMTNTEEFCTSCHEMQIPYKEFKTTTHFSSPSGVQASCSDCHVPKEFIPKMIRKVEAAREVYHTVLGTFDTPEKFNAHRREMAERVWTRMHDNDSQACRNCHNTQRWVLEDQSRTAQKKHGQARKDRRVVKGQEAETCIDCHKGEAHELPD